MKKNDKNRTKALTHEERKNARKTGFYYSFLTIVLLFCLLQIGYGAILNIGKNISYKAKMVTLEREQKQAFSLNEDLKAERKVITSDNSIEEIARNNLKLAEDDEVLVIINKKEEEPKKKKEFKLFKHFEKSKNKKQIKKEELNIPKEMVDE